MILKGVIRQLACFSLIYITYYITLEGMDGEMEGSSHNRNGGKKVSVFDKSQEGKPSMLMDEKNHNGRVDDKNLLMIRSERLLGVTEKK